jgi:saccharopine dehydrogenase (NAD+, L-lysine-forming)
MAQVAIRDLVEHGMFNRVAIATRSRGPADDLVDEIERPSVKMEVHELDVRDTERLVGLMRGSDAVCNLAGPNYQTAVPVVRAALSAGVSLVDVSDDFESTLEILALDGAARRVGVTVIVGLGASPGVTNVLARYGANRLDRVDEVHTAWIMRGSDPGGAALARHLLYSLPYRAFVFENGAMCEVQPFIDGCETVEFPELGAVEVMHIGHPEPFTLPRYIDGVQYADDKATFLPTKVNDLIVRLGPVARFGGSVEVDGTTIRNMDDAADYLHRMCKGMVNVPKTGAVRTEVRGELEGRRVRLVYAAAGRIAIGTGVPASIGAHMLALGKVRKPGVFPPEACIDPQWFLEAISTRDIGSVEEHVMDE